MRNQSPNLIAGGTIYPHRFVKVSTAADNTALQGSANAAVIGISGVGTKDAPGVTGNTYAAAAADPLEIFGLGDIPLLEAGSGGFTRGDWLKSDADGKGVPIAGTGGNQNIGAKALESAAEGELGRVQIVILSIDPDEEEDANFADDQPLYFGTSDDAGIMFSTGDASNNTFVVALDDTSQQVHITDKGARATDWNVSAATHPEVFIHSNTTPATDYLLIGAHDGSTCWLNAFGASTMKLGHAGLETLILATASSAVNEVTITPGATTVAPSIAPSGGDTHISLELGIKGTTAAVRVNAPLTDKRTQTATTDTATLTIAQLLTKVIDGTPTGAATYTLPTAANLVAGIVGCKVGDSFEFVVNNKAAGADTITLAAGSGGTADGTLTVAQNVIRKFLVIITNVTGSSEAYFVYGIG